MSALSRSIEYYGRKIKEPLSTLYIGGGTPSLMTERELTELVYAVHKNFDTSLLSEVTVEANPESITESFMHRARHIGIDRLSLGIQSFDDKELSAIGRLHSGVQAQKAIELAGEYFENISCDLIFGLPGQTMESLEKNLDFLMDYQIPHISCYNLQVEEGTPLYRQKISVPDEEIQRQMYFKICSRLEDKGYNHYEISNFAKRGFEAVHNGGYWTGADYLGLGPAAHSKIGNTRFGFYEDIENFIRKTDFEPDFSEEITDPVFEKIMLGLRTSEGADMSPFSKSRGYIDMLCKEGFATKKEERLVLTDKGFYLSNTIISDITAKEC